MSRRHPTGVGSVGCWWRLSGRCDTGCYWMDQWHPSHTSKQRCVRSCFKILHPFEWSLSLSICCTLIDFYPVFNPVYSAVALSAMDGQVLWKKITTESVMYIQCGLQYAAQPSPVVILISRSIITVVNGTTGKETSCSLCVSFIGATAHIVRTL